MPKAAEPSPTDAQLISTVSRVEQTMCITFAGQLDLVVEHGQHKTGFEIKFSSIPKPTKGFWQACEDVGVRRAYVVAPVREGWPMADNVEVVSPLQLSGLLA